MVGRPEELSQSLPNFRFRLSVVCNQKSLNVLEQSCNVYWSKVWIQLTPKLKCAIYITAVPLSIWPACTGFVVVVSIPPLDESLCVQLFYCTYIRPQSGTPSERDGWKCQNCLKCSYSKDFKLFVLGRISFLITGLSFESAILMLVSCSFCCCRWSSCT